MPKPKKPFTIIPYGPVDKWIELAGPELNIRVDYDDVQHSQVKKNMRKMIDILNAHWDDTNSQPSTKE